MKSRTIAAFAAMLCAHSGFAETLAYTATFRPEDVSIQSVGNGESWISLADGNYGLDNPGKPTIPTKSFSVRLPADTAVAGCTVTLGETVLLAEGITPVCEQRPVPGIAENPESTPRDEAAYASTDPYPAARCAYVATSSMRGIQIASFRLAPVWYVAAERKLYLAKSVTVEIETNPVFRPLSANDATMPSSGLFEAAANSLVINPSVPRYAKDVPRGGSGCQYLVITSNSFVSVAQKLADFRASFNGVTAAVVDTATINTNYAGTDLQEKIRACIKWYVQNKGTEYVVLAGDDTVVPARMAKLDSSLYPSATAKELVTPSDIYYSDLDATWTKDYSDATWGSWNCGSTYSGLAPDVIVGRLPMRTPTQLDGYITKVVAYERGTTDDSDIVRKSLFGGYTCWEELYRKSGGWEQHYVYSASACSVTQSSVTSLPETFNDGLREVGDRTTDGLLAADVEVWARRLNHAFHRAYYPCLRTSFFFNSATSWDKSTSTNSLQTVTRFMEVLNQGYHQLFFDTHGGFSSWGLGGTFTYDGSSTRGSKASYLGINAERLAGRVDFIYTSACNTGAFDLEEPSLSEGFLRASGGAIGYIGCSRYGWGIQMGKVSGWGAAGDVRGPSKDFASAFWRRLFVSKDQTLGAAFANHKNAMIADTSYQDYNKWLQLGINLQGDPLATYHLPPSDETRTSTYPGLVTLLRDNPIVTTADGATIGLAADEIPCGKTAKVELEYSKNSNFSSSTSVTVASSLSNLDEIRHYLSGLSAGTTYHVRGKITVDGHTNLSPFSLSFTTKAAGTATVAGRVENRTGWALSGITVSAVAEGGTTVAMTTTDANGNYQLAVPSGWTGSIVLSDSEGRISSGLSKPVALGSNAFVTLDFKVSGALFYVKQGATGSGDGSSWANAFTTIDAAFAAVEPGSVVWVAEGVYTPDTTLYGRDSHFAPPAYVAVYGGFAGNETSLEERDWIAHPTVLSADIGTKGTKTDNCYHVVRYNKGVLIDGFGLTGAYLDSTVRSSGYEDNYGAVVGTPLSNPAPVPSSTYPAEAPDEVLTLDHCAITNNVVPKRNGSGYGDLTSSSAKAVVRIRNTFVADNDVAGSHLFTNVSVENCTLTRNKSYSSGLCNCHVRNCLYLGNQKETTGQGEPGTTSGTSWRGENFFIYFYDNKVSAGSGNFMADSYYIRSDQNLGITGAILASGNNPAGWIADEETGFAHALAPDSAAADKGAVLDWMDEGTLDYLGHPRVYGSAPDLGCCEATEPAEPGKLKLAIQASGTATLTTLAVQPRVTDFGASVSSAAVSIEYSTSSEFTSAGTQAAGTATTTDWMAAVTLSSLQPNTRYFIRATATVGGEKIVSSAIALTTSDYGTPSASVSFGNSTLTTIPVSWSVASLGEGNTSATVTIEYGKSGSFGSSVVAKTVTGADSGMVTLEDLDAETTYFVRVKVVASPGDKTGVSSTGTKKTADVGKPAAGSIEAVNVGQRTVDVNWSVGASIGDGAKSATVYIEWGSGYGSSIRVAEGVAAGASGTVTLEGLEPGTAYSYRIRIVNNAGKEEVATDTFTTKEEANPAFTMSVVSTGYTSASLAFNITKFGGETTSVTILVEAFADASCTGTPVASATSAPITSLGQATLAITGLGDDRTYTLRATVTNTDAGFAQQTGTAKTQKFGDLAPGSGYWQGGFIMGYRSGSGQWDIQGQLTDAESATYTASGTTASMARKAISAYAKSGVTFENELDGKEYSFKNNGSSWGRIFSYEGEMWMEKGVTYAFASSFFIVQAIYVDGERVVSESNGGGSTPAVGTVTPTTTGWHSFKLANVSCGNGGGALSNPWNSASGNPFYASSIGAAWSTNVTTVTAGNVAQWNLVADAGDRRVFRAKGTKPVLVYVDQAPTFTADGFTIPVRTESQLENCTLTVYAGTDCADAWYFEERWAKAVSGGTVATGAQTTEVAVGGLTVTDGVWVSARLRSNDGSYDCWTDPVYFEQTTPPVVPPSGTVAASAVSFTTATVTATVTDLGSETSQGDVAISLVVSANSDYSSPVFSDAGATQSLTGLSPNTTYYVKATFTGANTGATTATATFRTSAYTAPEAPTVSVGDITRNSAVATVTLGAWGDGASGGTVEVKLLSATDQLLETKSGSSGGAFTFDGLDPETGYKIVATATASGTGLSTSSAAQSFTTLAPPVVVPPSGTVAASSISFTTATVTAQITYLGSEASQSDVTIALVVSANGDYSSPVFSGVGAAQALTGLSPNTTYFVKATFTGANTGSSSATTTFKTSAYTAPATPTVNIGSITYDSAVATVMLGPWGDGASEGTAIVELLSAADQLLETRSLPAGGACTFAGLDPETSYKVVVTATAAVTGLSTSSAPQTFTTLAAPDIVLSAATAAVSDGGTNATLSVSVTSCNIDGASLALTLNGAPQKTWSAIGAGDYSFTAAVTPGSTNVFVFTAAGGGITRTATGSFVATTYVGWFDVRFDDEGFVAGEDWMALSTDKSGGSFTADGTVSSELTKGGDHSYVSSLEGSEGIIRYVPSHPSETGADVRLEGWAQVVSGSSFPEIPEGLKAGICFREGVPYGYADFEWSAIGETVLAEKTWFRYVVEFDYAGEDAPRVRYTIGGETGDWKAASIATHNVTALGFQNGPFGDFKAGYYSAAGKREPIELVRPEFATDGTGAVLADGTFSMTVSNPVKGAYYTVFTAETLTATFTAEADSVRYDGSASSLVLTVDGTSPTKFARIHVSTEPYVAGTAEP